MEEWPPCDCLISFHSKGFPLDKAIAYAALHKPYLINNLHMQYDIQDRRRVYSILESEGIQIPRYAVLDRDSPDPKRNYRSNQFFFCIIQFAKYWQSNSCKFSVTFFKAIPKNVVND